jgi:hypothetical protein
VSNGVPVEAPLDQNYLSNQVGLEASGSHAEAEKNFLKIGTPKVSKLYGSRLQNTEWNVERSDRIKVRNQQAGYQSWLQTRGI